MNISASTCLSITYVCIMKNYPKLINMGTYIPSHCIALHWNLDSNDAEYR